MSRWKQALRTVVGLGFMAEGLVKLVKQELMGEPEQEGHNHADARELHEAALSWARTIFSHASHTHAQSGVTAKQVRMLAKASEEMDNCFVAQSSGAVLLTSWLVNALAEVTGADPDELYAAIKLQLAQIGTDVPAE